MCKSSGHWNCSWLIAHWGRDLQAQEVIGSRFQRSLVAVGVGDGSVDVGCARKQLGGGRAVEPIDQVAGDLERYPGLTRARRDGVLQRGIASLAEGLDTQEGLLVGLKTSGMQAERVFNKIHQAIAIGIGVAAANRVVRHRVRAPKERAPGLVSERRCGAAGQTTRYGRGYPVRRLRMVRVAQRI